MPASSNRKRIGFLAGGAARHPDPDRFLRPFALEQFGKHVLGDLLEGLGIAEECRDRDQQIAEQRLRFVGIVTHNVVIFFQIVGARDLHPPRDPAQHGRTFVLGKIVTGAHPQMRENAPQQFLVEIADVGNRHAVLDPDQIDQPLGEIVDRHDKIGNAGGNRAARHRGIFGLARFLNQDDAAGLLHRAHADRTVGAGAAQDDSEAVAQFFGERTEEQIDRRALAARLIEFKRGNFVIDHLQPPIRRNDIDVIGFQMLPLTDFDDRHACARRDDIDELAAMLWVEMHDDDECGAGAVWQRREQVLQGRHATG